MTHINAVTLWSTYNKQYNNNFNHQRQHSRRQRQADFYDQLEAKLASQAIDDGVDVASLSACAKLAAAASVGFTLVGASAQATHQAYSTHDENLMKPKKRDPHYHSRSRIAKKMGPDGFPGVTTVRLFSDLFHFAKECSHECSLTVVPVTETSSCNNNGSITQQICQVIPRGGGSETLVDAASTGAAMVAGTPWGISLTRWKIIFQIFLTALNVLCWLIPLRAKKFTENKLALSLANAFSGGIFLSLAFGHLIPECVHGFHGYNEALPYMTVLGGYLLIFFVEKVAFDAHGILHEWEEVGDTASKAVVQQKEEHNHDVAHSGRSALILLGALAVHSILEMTALGLANSFSDSALLTFSIGIHQPAESLALLVAFLKSGMKKKDIIYFLSIFSCFGPIGCYLGMTLHEFATPLIDSFMLATVAGTFVYVGATEVIPEEWEEQDHKWKKFGCLMAGIVSIFAITQYTNNLEEGIFLHS